MPQRIRWNSKKGAFRDHEHEYVFRTSGTRKGLLVGLHKIISGEPETEPIATCKLMDARLPEPEHHMNIRVGESLHGRTVHIYGAQYGDPMMRRKGFMPVLLTFLKQQGIKRAAAWPTSVTRPYFERLGFKESKSSRRHELPLDDWEG